MLRLITSLLCVVAALATRTALSDEALVAVAASFVPPMEAVAAAIEAETTHTVTLVSGSTGGLYAQIVNGAPFDVFVAADAERPRLLDDGGQGLADTRTTVALGRLVVLSSDAALINAHGLDALRDDSIRRIAIANPSIAPYGVAAQEVLEALGLWQAVQPRLIRGESVAQTYAMTATANAELGFVALAQALAHDGNMAYAHVPDNLHTPIRQDMIVLERARENAAARIVHDFLRGARGREIVERFGYGAPSEQSE
ncbi:MAG: molybdate ABC transporter substrate-binding protein [Gammaproteobacteria bacterium]|nr:molybdate ABC transporter substrate-binding protein [Gammaproteobacteria bacterium]